MKAKLTAVLLKHGQTKLAEELGLSTSEINRKINEGAGWSLDQLAAAFEFVGASVVDRDRDRVISNEELSALRTLAKKSLDGAA